LTGTITAPECGGGYEIENANVDVRDQNDTLIGATTTGLDQGTGSGCTTSFSLQVPKATFYQAKIGTLGGPSYTFAELQA
jgi:hypothetical protein